MSIFFKSILLALCFCGIAYGQSNLTMPTNSSNSAPSLNDDNRCLPDWITPLQTLPAADAFDEISGRTLLQPQKNQYHLIGDAKLTQPGLVLLSDEIFYDKNLQTIDAFGRVELQQTGVILLGDRAEYDQQNQLGFITDIQYQFRDSRAHGKARRIDFNQTQRISELENASFTSCPLDDQAWKLHFKELQINDPKRRLYGYHTWLEFKGLPVFYTPYIDIPLDDRASGLLFPFIGSHKAAAQNEPFSVVAIPYYFNIAPNYDDTLTFIGIQERGLVLDNEFRYLQPKHNGVLQLSLLNDQLTQKEGLKYVLPSGELKQDEPLTQRWRLSYDGRQNWGRGVSSSINWHEVSDPDFYNDIPLNFGSNQSFANRQDTRINRSARLNYRQGPLQAHIQHYGYLPLRNGENNFLEKSPEIGVNLTQRFGQLQSNLYLESAEFVRYSGFNPFIEDGYVSAQRSTTGAMGQRLVAEPNLIYRLDRQYGYLQAQVKANFRQYHLQQALPEASDSNSVMQYALRGGLVFERDFNLFNNDFVQTLEPEVQWLYVPYVKQQHLKTFDTGMASLDFSNLFQLNRFSGFDRIGDTHQISVALTNRILSELGRPLADAAIGQVFYLQDREITLRNDQLQTDTRSDYFVKLGVQIEHIYLASTNQFDKEDLTLSQTQNRFKLKTTDALQLLATHQGLNLNQPKPTQTLGAGLIWQINTEWQTAHYINYDIEEKQQRELLSGLRYDDCCWAIELVYERNQHADTRYNESVKFMIELKGLSTVGHRLGDTIKQMLNF